MPKVFRIFLGIFILCLCSSFAQASTIVLDSGLMVMGKIIERTATRITIEVEGSPETFFLGEVRSIDGHTIDIPLIKPQLPVGLGTFASSGTKTIVVPYYEGEEDSLIRFMNVLKKQSVQPSIAPAPKPIPTEISYVSKKTNQPISKMNSNFKGVVSNQSTPAAPMATAPIVLTKPDVGMDANKNILTTSDGGIIVVSQAKITKFDKDLNVIKQVNLSQPLQ